MTGAGRHQIRWSNPKKSEVIVSFEPADHFTSPPALPKVWRREKVKAKRKKCGKKRRPLRRAKAGADQTFKELKIVTYYDESKTHPWDSGRRETTRTPGS